MKNITKEIFLNTLVCPVPGWLMRNGGYHEELSAGDRFRIEQGEEIGRRARELYPDGVLVAHLDAVLAAEQTRELMADTANEVIFEGAFIDGDFVARADILRRTDKGWHLYEVKSGANGKAEFVDDMAYTAMTLRRSGVEISGISLILVSKDYRLGMENSELFRETDYTGEVLEKVSEFEPYREKVDEVTRLPVRPEPRLIYECHNCECFGECVGEGIDNHIFELPRLTRVKFESLVESGIVRIEDVPAGFKLTERQTWVRDCLLSGRPFVGKRLKNSLESISYPAYYLDFETVMTAIPLYPDTAPYTQIPTQYSLHIRRAPGGEPEHKEYLASDPSRDCRRELAERLLEDLGDRGSIVIYSTFEKAVVNGLMLRFPDLLDRLGPLVERMVDLEAIIRKNFYHPGFHGRTSIKKTLPVLAPDMSYEDLEIGEGDTAMVVFAYLATGRYEAGEAEIIKRQLLKYCERDTLAMVRLHDELSRFLEET